MWILDPRIPSFCDCTCIENNPCCTIVVHLLVKAISISIQVKIRTKSQPKEASFILYGKSPITYLLSSIVPLQNESECVREAI